MRFSALECSLDDTNKSPSEFVTLSQAGQRLQGELNEWAARLPSYELRRSEQASNESLATQRHLSRAVQTCN